MMDKLIAGNSEPRAMEQILAFVRAQGMATQASVVEFMARDPEATTRYRIRKLEREGRIEKLSELNGLPLNIQVLKIKESIK
jgi:hypothetical protein